MGERHHIRLGESVLIFIVSSLALALALKLFDASVRRGLTIAAVVIVINLSQTGLQPLLHWISRSLGLIGIILVCLLSSTLVVWLALELVPGITLQRHWHGIAIAWLYGLIITVAQWLLVARSDDIFLSEILRISRSATKNNPATTPGFAFLQLDGVSAPLLDWQLKAGNLPNIARLINNEGYLFDRWRAQPPSTTPASQAGILLGSNRDIPGFRWYDKQSDQLIVANDPVGASIIEQRHSNGKGLLTDGGVSIGNLFSGDAPTNIMVMSRLTGDRQSMRQMQDYTAYFSSPFGYIRSVILSVGEILKELYQARRQVALDIRPRISRRVGFIIQRVATNVLLRYLQTYIVVHNMLAGVNRLYVDFLDYDEIAHHAGIARPEALDALTGIDRTIGIIARARQYTTRPYTIILLSDHGQSQGPTFRQLHSGRPIESFVAEYTANDVIAATDPIETVSSSRSWSAQRIARHNHNAHSKSDDTSHETAATSNIVVAGSGNVASIWFKDLRGRASYETLRKRHPRLITSLLDTKGIGLILVKSATRGHLCLSAHGTMLLETGDTEGANPLTDYEYADRSSILRLATMKSAPDLAVMAAYDISSGETYAFEELVGNHGGYGGWQTEGILLHPPHLKLPSRYRQAPIIGAESLHKILKRWADAAQYNPRHLKHK